MLFFAEKIQQQKFSEQKILRTKLNAFFCGKKFSEQNLQNKNFAHGTQCFFAEKIQRTKFSEQKILRAEHNAFFAEKIQQQKFRCEKKL
jgi:hypothetical protein